MSYIKMIKESKATGKLKRLYTRCGAKGDDSLDNILKIHSLSPDSLKGHWELYRGIMYGESSLTKAQREMIAVVVSQINECEYWLVHHGEGLRKETSLEFVNSLRDYRTATLSEFDMLMLLHAEKLTLKSNSITPEDIEQLRSVGFTDQNILDINQVTAYYAYVNRVASGLGVELEKKD